MEFSDMSLVGYMGSMKLKEQRMSLFSIQAPMFSLYANHVKLGQLSRLQERHLAISRSGLTMRWKANERGPPESCELNIPLDSLIYSNATKHKKSSKKKKDFYCSFQPIGNIDRYNSALFSELQKPYTYLYGQAYTPHMFVFVTASLHLHAVVCSGEQQYAIHKVRVCDNLKQSNQDELAYQSSNNGMDSSGQQQLYYGDESSSAREASPVNNRAIFRPDQDSTYQNKTSLRESRAHQQHTQSGRDREESPYYERHLPSPDIVPEEQVYRKLPINKVLPSAFIPNVALREVPKDRNGHVPLPDFPQNHEHSGNGPTSSQPLLRSAQHHKELRAISQPTPLASSRPNNHHHTSLPHPPSGPAPKVPIIYNHDDGDFRSTNTIVMKGTKDEEIVASFSGIDLSAPNSSFDMNNLHDALGYLP